MSGIPEELREVWPYLPLEVKAQHVRRIVANRDKMANEVATVAGGVDPSREPIAVGDRVRLVNPFFPFVAEETVEVGAEGVVTEVEARPVIAVRLEGSTEDAAFYEAELEVVA